MKQTDRHTINNVWTWWKPSYSSLTNSLRMFHVTRLNTLYIYALVLTKDYIWIIKRPMLENWFSFHYQESNSWNNNQIKFQQRNVIIPTQGLRNKKRDL